ncbi:MAG: tandem-95 repeat protein [Pirellulaceae bacterium]|nr:tandem-95 repeat protein [Pirellulaceae bacterium]
MKSRKPAKVSKKSRRADRHRKSLSGALRLFETLEDRKLLTVAPWSDGLYYPPTLATTGLLRVGTSVADIKAISAVQYGNAAPPSGMSGEGTQPFINTLEVEPNNNASQAQFINLGTGPGQSDGVTVVGSLPLPSAAPGLGLDEDYYAFDLRIGDILDARVDGTLNAVFDLSIQNANRQEVLGSSISMSSVGVYPASSPLSLTGTPNADLAFVVPQTGRYYARVSDGDSAYSLTMRVRRPVLESEAVGTKQKIFLDFDGAFVRREVFGAGTPGTARLSPLSSFLTGWGLSAADENRIIDRVVAEFTQQFNSNSSISVLGFNGDYNATAAPGQFGVEILNSRDNPDVFGQPNVTRLIIGGTVGEFGFSTIGLAQSIDVGNFATSETAVILLDGIQSDFVDFVPRAANKSAEDVIVKAIANVAVHELGHLTGAWHTNNANALKQIMDSGGTLAANSGLLGAGADGIFGTADDVVPGFGTDAYALGAGVFGMQNSAVLMAYGLATGTAGGAVIKGNVYQDTNSNRVRDAGDLPLVSVVIYNDANNNAKRDAGELSTATDVNGNYQMTVPAGVYTLRELTPAGQKLVSPASLTHVVSVTNNQTVAGRDFINEKVNPVATGYKWNDFNGNGIRDIGEPGIKDVYIYVDLDLDGRIDIGEPAAKTNADGSYKLTFPGPGMYSVKEVLEPGFTQTLPGAAAGFQYVVTLTGNPTTDAASLSGLNFGNNITVDYGDAPATYGIASSGFKSGLTLGTLWDSEAASLFSPDARGDDNDKIDDEDGIDLSTVRPLIAGSSNNPITVMTTNTTGQTAYLQAWIDFNGNGVFTDPGEQVVTNQPVAGTALPPFNVSVPATATIGNTFARLRLSTAQNIGPTGQSIDGEVEDYAIAIRPDSSSLAIDDTATVRRNSVLNPIDVLANDIRIGNETLEVVNVSGSAAGGLVTFTPTGVLYTPPAGFIGTDTFTYQARTSSGEIYPAATVTVTVALFFDNPFAIDDSFDVPTNAIDFPLNVVANDIEGENGALSIVSVTQPDKGGNLSIATGNKSLRYTPSRDFGGTEFFTYTVSDAAGKTSIARGTIHTLPGDRTDDKLQIRLVATDLAGNPIARIQQGQQFKVDMYVDDLRYHVNDPLKGTDPPNPSPTLDAGVFAAYTDLLYNLQLVSTVAANSSTPSGFNFAVNFFNNYQNGLTGDAAIPGIIDELGAFFDGSTMNRPDPVRLASVTFQAKTPGIARFLADPADANPASNSILFDTSATPVPADQVRYLGADIEIVGDGVVFPAAVDDSPSAVVPANAVQFPIDVLANDLPGSSGPLTLKPTGLGSPLNGTVVVSGNRVLYTPRLGFTGSDQFTYTAVDTVGNESIAKVTLKVGNNTAADDIVSLPLRVTDLSGAPITQVSVGQQFQLRGYVQDLRTTGSDLGVFAAYQDVIYSSALTSPVSSTTNPLGFQVTFGPNYQRVLEGDVLTRGLFNEIGAVATSDTPTNYGTTEQLLFTITLTANALGNATFVGDPADISPLHDTLTFQPVTPVPFGQVRFGLASVNIVGVTTFGGAGGEFTNNNSPLDVNADGFVSPIDALVIINALNSGGARSLMSGLGGEGEGANRFFIDTNGDGFLSPMDVLGVINYLNTNSGQGAVGEGEGSRSSEPLAASDAVYSDDLFDDGVDELIGQLAPDIEQTWKKQRV